MWVKEAVDFHNMEKIILWKSMTTINFLVTHILQNNCIYVQQKKEIHTGLEQNLGE